MEEEKKLEETSTEPKREVEESEEVESKKETPFLETRPYHNKYKNELDEANTDETATVPSKDTQEATPEKVERPVNAEDKVFKKRYDDLKRHYDSTLTKHKEEVFKLKHQVEGASQNFVPPKDKKELEEWRKEYPDVYDVIKTVAHQEADDKSQQLNNKLAKLQIDQQKVSKDRAEVELLGMHPDFTKIRESQDFHDWASVQDSVIQGWLYDNFDNSNLASRAIDLYKMDKGIKKIEADRKDVKKEASKVVTSTARNSEKDLKGKKVWNMREIQKLKPQEFVKFEKEIDSARREGRIRN